MLRMLALFFICIDFFYNIFLNSISSIPGFSKSYCKVITSYKRLIIDTYLSVSSEFDSSVSQRVCSNRGDRKNLC